MDLIYTNRNREDIGVLQDFSLDLAFGSGENDFELTVSRENHVAVAGCFVYIQGTEYGGIIDAVKSDTGAEEVVYSGRTWHGILNSKILEPDAGQAYLTVSGDANAVLATLISRMGLGTLFTAASGTSGIAVNNYQFDRYISGYNGILKMLKTVGAKLHMEHDGTNVVVSAVPVTDYTQDGVSNDQTALTVTQTKNKVNHLICLGTGELADRMVIHLYADGAGNISRTQTFTGLDEYTAVYDYSSVESEEDLVSGGMERFEELLQQDQLDVDFPESDDIYDVGDIVGAADNVTGISIAVPVTKKIIKIEGDLVSVSIETTTESVSAQASAGGGSGGGGSAALIAGDGIEISGRTISALPPVAGAGIAVDGRKISAVVPRNLLDNSDFRNPVNQRGKSSYSGSTYTIDRWRTWGSSDVVTLSSDGITISAEALWQYMKETAPEPGKTYTAAVKLADGTISVSSGALRSTGYSFGNEHFSIGIDGNNKSLYFGLKSGAYIWAALYIGEFTADTLPEYQPKGWAVELAECQRYYRYYQFVTFAVPGNPWAWFALNYPPMRAVPTLTTGALCAGGSTQISGAKITSARVSETGVSVVYITGANEAVYYAENVELSAE